MMRLLRGRAAAVAIAGFGCGAASASVRAADGVSCDDAIDVVVVGGGIVGCSAALHAARAQARLGRRPSVRLLERDGVGSGATSLSAGTMYCVGDNGGNALAAADGTDLFPWLWALSRDLVAELGMFTRSGSLTVACNEREAAELERRHKGLRDAGCD